jgi:hypothetical protein
VSFNKISRARNLLNKARESIGNVQLDPEVYGSLSILLVGVNDSLEEAVAILPAPPPTPRPGRPTLVYSPKPRWNASEEEEGHDSETNRSRAVAAGAVQRGGAGPSRQTI